ncbi:hypothetical protein M422DRAFT_232796 [Sphaerobolus stellatus SS14]|uniref:Peptide hydrolase n=1 Tax=Sphaerobolus stellatus (strain SS14) TaxID=990650 RepID=A0A0C9UMG8_SPHS4|nr:hypothetical protein M422DRAFT_236544 [Sphaerobolus stellatus SS14]KIJ35728.1 hypothetical protein M422DRAFT_232796 [Sphaerobolus stellatus SS14]
MFSSLWFILAISITLLAQTRSSKQASSRRSLQELSTEHLTSLASLRDPEVSLDFTKSTSHLSKILIPRAPGTQNNTFVKNYLVDTLKALNWHVEEDAFTDNTPEGSRLFTNVIATKNPKAPRRIVLAAHFDSKFFSSFPQNQFVGATDSAAPCAILLDLAEVLNPLLDARQKRIDEGAEADETVAETTLQLLFLDGEEAFHDWTATDSIYGARHLAEKWDNEYVTHSKRRVNPPPTVLSSIEHFVLLDLLGSANPLIRSYFLTTAWLFDGLISAERRLDQIGLFKDVHAAREHRSFFIPRSQFDRNSEGIEDDHIPFLKRGVSILHIIPMPFPRVWHTLKDDASALDLPTLRKWAQLFRVFTAEYLNLNPDDSLTPRSEHDEL